MKTVHLEELDEKTSQWLRDAARYDQVVVTERGQPIATIQPARLASSARKFSERKLLPGFKALMESGKLRGGTALHKLFLTRRGVTRRTSTSSR